MKHKKAATAAAVATIFLGAWACGHNAMNVAGDAMSTIGDAMQDAGDASAQTTVASCNACPNEFRAVQPAQDIVLGAGESMTTDAFDASDLEWVNFASESSTCTLSVQMDVGGIWQEFSCGFATRTSCAAYRNGFQVTAPRYRIEVRAPLAEGCASRVSAVGRVRQR